MNEVIKNHENIEKLKNNHPILNIYKKACSDTRLIHTDRNFTYFDKGHVTRIENCL